MRDYIESLLPLHYRKSNERVKLMLKLDRISSVFDDDDTQLQIKKSEHLGFLTHQLQRKYVESLNK